ncbi:hypothetical protein AHAS_Ahas12G0097000 [Arachis hypogaea]
MASNNLFDFDAAGIRQGLMWFIEKRIEWAFTTSINNLREARSVSSRGVFSYSKSKQFRTLQILQHIILTRSKDCWSPPLLDR